MGPAELALRHRLAIIRLGPITGQNRPVPHAQQFLKDLGAARGANVKHTDPLRHHTPQPRPALLLPPGGLIHVGVLGLDIGTGCLHRWLQRLGHRLLHLTDLPDRQRDPQHVRTEAGNHAFAHAVGAATQRDQARQAGPVAAGRHPGRQRPTGRDPTAGTDQAMQLIFGDLRRGGRHLQHLVPPRLRIPPVQGLATPSARVGLATNHLSHLLHWNQGAGIRRMPGLRPAFAPRGLVRGLVLHPRPTRRRGARGVLRGLVQLLLQLPYLTLQACDLSRQSRHALLVAVHHDPQRSLNRGRDLVPQFLRQGQLSPHDTVSHSLKTAFPQV